MAWGEDEDFFRVKGAVEALAEQFGLTFDYQRADDTPWLHPGISARILCKGQRIGCFGKLANDVTAELRLPKDSKNHQNIYLGEIDYVAFSALADANLRYKPIPEFDVVSRDLALVADEAVTCGDIVGEMHKACPHVGEIQLFDVYRGEQLGEGKKSMAFTLHFVPADKPLESAEVDRYVKKILGNLKYRLGVEIR